MWMISSKIRRLIVCAAITAVITITGCRLEQYFDDMNIKEHGKAGDEGEITPDRVHGGII